jgi:cysteine-rich repeat protein
MSKAPTRLILLGLVGLTFPLAGCPSDAPADTGSGTDEVGPTSTETGDTDESASESGSSDSGSETADETASETTADTTATDTADTTDATETETATDTGNVECGNGLVEGDEQCDNGVDNAPTGDCLVDCTFNICGDTFVGPIEGCDDGNLVDGDGCSAMCLLEDIGDGTILCGNKVYACGDTIDNDQDGDIDLDDPECISPCDDNEGSFQTELPGQNNDCKQDCYFDDNSGGGDDTCEWNLQCDPMNPGAAVGCPYDPDFAMCDIDMPQTCLEFCTPLVPNGCDCFGCCEIEGQFVYLDSGEGCSIDNLDACEECTFFENCNNPCMPEMCELCFGQDPEDLPPECDMASCPDGVTSCDGIEDCPVGQFCQTGCCVDIQPQ